MLSTNNDTKSKFARSLFSPPSVLSVHAILGSRTCSGPTFSFKKMYPRQLCSFPVCHFPASKVPFRKAIERKVQPKSKVIKYNPPPNKIPPYISQPQNDPQIKTKPNNHLLNLHANNTPRIIPNPDSRRCILAHPDLIPANRVHRPLRRNSNLSTRHRPPVRAPPHAG